MRCPWIWEQSDCPRLGQPALTTAARCTAPHADTNLTFTTIAYYNRGLSPDELLQAVHVSFALQQSWARSPVSLHAAWLSLLHFIITLRW